MNLLHFLYEQKQRTTNKKVPESLNEIHQHLNELEQAVNERSTIVSTHETENQVDKSNIDLTERFEKNELVVHHPSNNDQLKTQLQDLSECLFMFIREQKTFNRQVEDSLIKSSTPTTVPNSNQSLLVDLNAAYRQITVLQSEINALQSENTRLLSSLSFEQHYHHFNENSLLNFRGNLRQNRDEFVETSQNSLNHKSSKQPRPLPLMKGNNDEQRHTPIDNVASPRPTPVQTNYSLTEKQAQSDQTTAKISKNSKKTSWNPVIIRLSIVLVDFLFLSSDRTIGKN